MLSPPQRKRIKPFVLVAHTQTNKQNSSQHQPKTQFKIQTVFITNGLIQNNRFLHYFLHP